MELNPQTHSRRQQKEERREQILDSALATFSEKGFAGASVRDIARHVGVTEGLIYHYFESKDQLMNACFEERSWRPELERVLSTTEDKPIAQVLEEIIRSFLASLRKHGPMVRMCASEMQINEQLAERHRARILDNQRLICECLMNRQSRLEIRTDIDLFVSVALMLGSAYSLFVFWGHLPDEEWDRMADSLSLAGVDIICNGLCK